MKEKYQEALSGLSERRHRKERSKPGKRHGVFISRKGVPGIKTQSMMGGQAENVTKSCVVVLLAFLHCVF